MNRADFHLEQDLAPPPHDAPLPDPEDADHEPWAHEDPWTQEQAEDSTGSVSWSWQMAERTGRPQRGWEALKALG